MKKLWLLVLLATLAAALGADLLFGWKPSPSVEATSYRLYMATQGVDLEIKSNWTCLATNYGRDNTNLDVEVPGGNYTFAVTALTSNGPWTNIFNGVTNVYPAVEIESVKSVPLHLMIPLEPIEARLQRAATLDGPWTNIVTNTFEVTGTNFLRVVVVPRRMSPPLPPTP